MKVSVAVRQKFHGFNLANELESVGVLEYLYTSFYGKLFGKDNAKDFRIKSDRVKCNYVSALLTYGMKNRYAFWTDRFFGNWVSAVMGSEDIIVTWGIQALPILYKAKENGIKVVLERGSAHVNEQRDIVIDEYDRYKISAVDTRRSFSKRRIERELLEYELADYVSIPSNYVRNTFIKQGFNESKLFLNPYGVDLAAFTHSKVPHHHFRIINVGLQSVRKGTHYLLQAFFELNLSNAELWLVGSIDSDLAPFIGKFSHPGLKFFGPVNQGQLVDYYNQCDLFVICSIQEGMAMVQLQAMACGLPIICTTNSGGEDLIGNDDVAGFVLKIRDVKELKERISYMYSNRNICSDMGFEAMQRVKSGYSWSDYGKRSIAFYSSILSS